MRALALVAVVLFAGCLDEAANPEANLPVAAEAADVNAPTCTPANTNNYGVDANGIYPESDGAWRETNGIPALQKGETCEGPADTRIAP
ncbi:MAG: hypothetical protein WC876_11510 [Candidatus Thermoplasmatota archaeon]|jgi:hypothetical protein